MIKDWVDVLTERGVWVKRARGFPRVRALIECLLSQDFVALDREQNLDSTIAQLPIQNEGIENELRTEENGKEEHPTR